MHRLIGNILSISLAIWANLSVAEIGRSEVREIQAILSQKLYEPGPIDGAWGTKTKTAAIKYLDAYGVEFEEQIDKSSIAKLVKQAGPFLAKNLTYDFELQALALLEHIEDNFQKRDIFGIDEAALLSKYLGRAITVEEPLSYKELNLDLQLKMHKISNWKRLDFEQIAKTKYHLDARLMWHPEMELPQFVIPTERSFCGPGKFEKRIIDGVETTVGNEGWDPLLYPIGDINGDGHDDLLIIAQRVIFSEELNRQNKDEFLYKPVVMVWSEDASNFVFDEKFSNSFADSLWIRRVFSLDFDNDGLLDLFLADHGTDFRPDCGFTNRLYKNIDGQKYEEVELPSNIFNDYSHGATVADFDGDGDKDIAVINSPFGNQKIMQKCKNAYGRDTIKFPYFLKNNGNMKFDLLPIKEFAKLDRHFWTGHGIDGMGGEGGHLILAESGKFWRDKNKPTLRTYKVDKNFRLKLVNSIPNPRFFDDRMVVDDFFIEDLDKNGTDELIVGNSYEVEFYDEKSMRNAGGGSYIQVIEGFLTTSPRDVTEAYFPKRQMNNLVGLGAWCMKLYPTDFDADGDTDILCSGNDQWTRPDPNRGYVVHPTESPIIHINKGGQFEQGIFSNNDFNKNKYPVPVNVSGEMKLAALKTLPVCSAPELETLVYKPN